MSWRKTTKIGPYDGGSWIPAAERDQADRDSGSVFVVLDDGGKELARCETMRAASKALRRIRAGLTGRARWALWVEARAAD